MIPKRTKDTDIATEVAQGKLLRQRIVKCAEEAASRFMQNENINEAIADIGRREHFNRLQLQRLVEEANTLAYNKRYETLRKEKNRAISFELAELSKILELMSEDAPPEEQNPNAVSGEKGEGEMSKAASIEPSYIHGPYGRLEAKREKMLEKRASFGKVEEGNLLHRLDRDVQSGIFHIANSLVMTERMHKKASETFNTLLDDIALDQDLVDGIQKKAAEIATALIDRKQVYPNFSVNLTMNPQEKVASFILGEHSLLKNANDNTKVSIPKVAATAAVASYEHLVKLAADVKRQYSELHSLRNHE